MKIAVCIKRVPVMDVRFAIAPDGKSVSETGLKFDVNDFDLWAVEAALQLKEKNNNAGEVVAVCLGPDAAQEQLRKALSMGADRAVLLKVDTVPMDGFAIAGALAAELGGGGYDLIFFGKQAVDSSNGIVGPMTAELLGMPCITSATRLDVAGGKATAQRDLEGAQEIVECPLPAVITVDQGLVAKERLPSLKGIMAAKKKPLEIKPATLAAPQVTVTKMELPPERGAGKIIGEGAAAVPELVRLLQTEAKVL